MRERRHDAEVAGEAEAIATTVVRPGKETLTETLVGPTGPTGGKGAAGGAGEEKVSLSSSPDFARETHGHSEGEGPQAAPHEHGPGCDHGHDLDITVNMPDGKEGEETTTAKGPPQAGAPAPAAPGSAIAKLGGEGQGTAQMQGQGQGHATPGQMQGQGRAQPQASNGTVEEINRRIFADSLSSGFGDTAFAVANGTPSKFPKVLGLTTWKATAASVPQLKVTAEQRVTTPGVKAVKAVKAVAASPASPGHKAVKEVKEVVGVQGVKEVKKWFAKVQAATSTGFTNTAIAVPSGTFKIPKSYAKWTWNKHRYDLQLNVTDEAHGWIVRAEQEHIDDYQRAYDITLKAALDAINSQSSAEFEGDSKKSATKDAKNAVLDQLDPALHNPAQWGAMMTRCAALSNATRDATGNHTFKTDAGKGSAGSGSLGDADWDHGTKTVTLHINNNPVVGTMPTATVVHL